MSILLIIFSPSIKAAQSWIDQVSPSQNVLNVDRATTITITFTADIEPTTLTDSTIIVHGSFSGRHRSHNIMYDIILRTATFEPDNIFYVGEVVNITLTTGIRNTNGIPMPNPYNWSFTIVTSAGSGIFIQTSAPNADNGPCSIVSGDFDTDGDLDLATSNLTYGNVSILLNDGIASFLETSTVEVGESPRSIISGDWDGDSDLDLAVANFSSNNLSILKNDGNAAFSHSKILTTVTELYYIEAGDFNGDGNLDLVLASDNFPNGTISVFVNNGSGDFTQMSSNITLGQNIVVGSIAVGDWEGDGDLDVAVGKRNSNTIVILQNNGKANLSLTDTLEVDRLARTVISGDWDSDGDLDLAVGNGGDNTVSILCNDSNADFTKTANLNAGDSPNSLITGDLDNDRDLDLIVLNINSENLLVFSNDGMGSFSSTDTIDVQDHPVAMTYGDWNSDGDLDLAVVKSFSNNVSILTNRELIPEISLSADRLNWGIVQLDSTRSKTLKIYNSGLVGNLIINDITSKNPAFTLDNTNGAIPPNDSLIVTISFTPQRGIHYSDSLNISSNDPNCPEIFVLVDGSGPPVSGVFPEPHALNVKIDTNITITFTEDIAPTTLGDKSINISGSLSGPYTISNIVYDNETRIATIDQYSPFKKGEEIKVTLINDIQTTDGRPVGPYSWSFLTNIDYGTGFFYNAMTQSVGGKPLSVTSGDWDKDGDVDLAVINNWPNSSVFILMNTGSEYFMYYDTLLITPDPLAATTGDWDGDNDLDLAIANGLDDNVVIFMNDGEANFIESSIISVREGPGSISSCDFDLDGDLDLVITNFDDNSLSILMNNGNGIFTEVEALATGERPADLIIGDWDTDGDFDLAINILREDAISIMLNDGGGSFTQTFLINIGGITTSLTSLAKGDWDTDGDLDLAVSNSATTDKVIILENNGLGNFTQSSQVNIGNAPRTIVSGDWNNDGELDLAVTNQYSDNVSILINDNNGGFFQCSTVSTEPQPCDITTADFDNDGDMDLLVTSLVSNTISLLKNRQSFQDIKVTPSKLDFGVVKIDSTVNNSFVIYNLGVDSSLVIQSIIPSDTAFTVNKSSGTILPNDSLLVTVSFTPSQFLSYKDSITIISNDLETPKIYVFVNGQSNAPILAVAPVQNALNVKKDTYISATFGEYIDPYTLSDSTFRINGSQTGLHYGNLCFEPSLNKATVKPDSIFNSGEIVNVTITRGIRTKTGYSLPSSFIWNFTIGVDTSSGVFSIAGSELVGRGPMSIITGDWDNDGDLDLAVANENSTFISILTNDGNGIFTHTAKPSAAYSLRTITSGDWDCDGDLDLAAGNGATGPGVSIFTNDSYGGFTETAIVPDIGHTWQIVNGDLDGDGDLDLATANNTQFNNISILTNDGDGSFTLKSALTIENTLWSITRGDWDKDGDMDLAAANRFDNISIITNDGNGSFTHTASINAGDYPTFVTSGDINNDGYLDLVVSNYERETYNILLLLNDKRGSFNHTATMPVVRDPNEMVLNDFDGDGYLDLAAINRFYTKEFLIFKNDGNGNFIESQFFDLNNTPTSLTTGDFDDDGDLDLAILLQGYESALILRNGHIVGLVENLQVIPQKFDLYQNYPNPFNPMTTIRYDVPKPIKIVLKIYNIKGQNVRTLVNNQETAGCKSVIWDSRNDDGYILGSGVYLCKIEAADFIKVIKLLLIK